MTTPNPHSERFIDRPRTIDRDLPDWPRKTAASRSRTCVYYSHLAPTPGDSVGLPAVNPGHVTEAARAIPNLPDSCTPAEMHPGRPAGAAHRDWLERQSPELT